MTVPVDLIRKCLDKIEAALNSSLTEHESQFARERCSRGVNPLWIYQRIRNERKPIHPTPGVAPDKLDAFWTRAGGLEAYLLTDLDVDTALSSLVEGEVDEALSILKVRVTAAKAKADFLEATKRDAALGGSVAGSKSPP